MKLVKVTWIDSRSTHEIWESDIKKLCTVAPSLSLGILIRDTSELIAIAQSTFSKANTEDETLYREVLIISKRAVVKVEELE